MSVKKMGSKLAQGVRQVKAQQAIAEADAAIIPPTSAQSPQVSSIDPPATPTPLAASIAPPATPAPQAASVEPPVTTESLTADFIRSVSPVLMPANGGKPMANNKGHRPGIVHPDRVWPD